MTIGQKLRVIQKMLDLNQTELACSFGVSFPTLNSWWNGKSVPRAQKQTLIEELYLEVTGQKVIPNEHLQALKVELQRQSNQYKSVIQEILSHPDIRDQFVLKLTYHSNGIEGSTLTEPDTAAILFDNVALPHKSLTEHMFKYVQQSSLMIFCLQVLGKTFMG